MKNIALGLVALSLMMTGCSHPPKSGYVAQKFYDDEDWWHYEQADYLTMCTGTSPYIMCYQMYIGSHTVYGHDRPHWQFRVRDDADPKGKSYGWAEVTHDTYDHFEVGEHWPNKL